jgi:heme exporter protein A
MAGLMQLIADRLTCVRGGRQVFAGLSFTLAGGEALMVTGPNGAGKSSLLRVVAGLLPPVAGSLSFDGGESDASIGEQAHYLGHADAMKPALTVRENLSFWSRYLGGNDAIEPALEAVGLARLADLPAMFLSAGQRRRLALARLVAVKRRLWLLDEPTAALDVSAQKKLAELMSAHLSGGGLIVAAAHGPIGLSRARELGMGAA